ncbi:hypothetical protein [Aureimonas sp. SK2]|uniref:hypothetical protein n=1 Tax=Aureimonas sp. SK2 TaxID=3015992 RepID=UPI0024445493|nr:hypothetical protein [Aureimonas sp. SK2]
MDVLSHLDHKGVARIQNLPNAIDPQEPITKAQLDAAVEGLSWKDSVRVATQGNISIASPGASIDGISLAVGDRVLVRAQTTASENGIYVWNGAATPLTRSADASTADELEQATVSVEEGTSANSTFRQTAVNFTIGSGAVNFAAFGTAAPLATDATAGLIEIATQAEVDAGTATNLAVTPATLKGSTYARKAAAGIIGDGAATQYDVVHNFATRRVQVSVRRTSGNYDQVHVESRAIDTNTVRLIFAQAPATNSFEVTVTA